MAREVKASGRTVYLPDREEWELCDSPATPERVAEDIDRAWPGLVKHELRCTGCGKTWKAGQMRERYHYAPAPGGWRRCGEWQ